MSIIDAIVPPAATPAAPESKLSPDEIRRKRGQIIAAICFVRPEGKDNRYRVPSQTGKRQYLVSIEPKKGPDWRCDCNDFEARQLPCKHIHAVKIVIEREKTGGAVAVPVATKGLNDRDKTALVEQASAPRPTYKQDWPAYNAAQIHEKDRFQDLLADLCRGVVEPAKPHGGAKGGRPPVPMADRVFAVALKVYTLMSGRRASSDMRGARDKGHLSRSPHYSRVTRFMEDPEMMPILGDLIRESALPLRAVEVDFAVDSTGFGTCRFVRWFDQKYGIVRQRAEFVKVSVMTGVKTNIVSAVRVGGQSTADSPEFIPLLNETAKGFKPREVSADKAYSGYDNFDAVAGLGAVAYMTFKDNATGRLGGTYAKMLREFNRNQDAYLDHYHKRSNVESTFSMMKAKFGDSLRSKTDVAMMNEALCKVLCHNVAVLISAACELGIEATFWKSIEPVQSEAAPLVPDDLVEAWAWV
jgi:transposase